MLFDYVCDQCGGRYEHLHSRSDTPTGDPPNTFGCSRCAGTLTRKRVYAIKTVGPVWTDLEGMNNVLLTSKQRANGGELKTAKDIERKERELGIFRESSHLQRVASEELKHDSFEITRVRDEYGAEAAVEYVDTTEIMKATGWDKKETELWKERTRAAESAIPDIATVADSLERLPSAGIADALASAPAPA
jgi:hypothetical protein